MTCRISINSGSVMIEVRQTPAILADVLHSQGIYLPGACGGRGICGQCKCQIVSPLHEPNEREKKKLTLEEITQGYRLSCQTQVTGDMQIEIPQEILKIRRYECVVEKITQLTYDIRMLRIKLVAPKTIKFHSGQFVQLEVPRYPGNDKPTKRSYSLASSPFENDYIELVIRRVKNGVSTTWVFDHLTEGETIFFSGPFGEFGLSDSDRPMIWIAGGSGMGPFLSMLDYLIKTNNTRTVTFFFGACTEKDLFLLDRLNAAAAQHKWFKFIPALSNECGCTDYDTGLITDVVDRHTQLEPDAEGYLCGSPGMCEAAIKVLEKKGIPERHLYHDKFIGQESLDTAHVDGRTVSWNPQGGGN